MYHPGAAFPPQGQFSSGQCIVQEVKELEKTQNWENLAITDGAQGLLLYLHSGISTGSARGILLGARD